MNEKHLAKWLMDLAACYDHVPQKAAITRYLRILGQWKLSAGQWEELADRAVMRLTRKFPIPEELHDISVEPRCTATIGRTDGPLWLAGNKSTRKGRTVRREKR